MVFFILMLGISLLAYLPQFFLGDRKDYRMALRHGMAGGFIFTGIDHFVNAQAQYVPMMPEALGDYALELVYFGGVFGTIRAKSEAAFHNLTARIINSLSPTIAQARLKATYSGSAIMVKWGNSCTVTAPSGCPPRC
jgi:hypothetical protein